MLQELDVPGSISLTHYNPDKGLKTIATATAAERYWKQAKDSRQLLQAIKAKLTAQARYVIWRDSVVVPSRQNGAPGRGKRVTMRRSVLPEADPGHKVAYRWRKKLCSKTANGTVIDGRKLDQELKNILSRCLFIIEFEHDKYDMNSHDDQILKQAKAIRRRQYADKHAKRIKNLIKISKGNGSLPTDQKYPVIYADPAWKFNFSTSLNRSFENHYPTMALDEIKALKVADLATPDAVLFLWAISAMLPDVIDVMRTWGFTYKSHAVWVKNQVGMGFWFRNQHELLLLGTRGDMPLPLEKNRLPSVISSPRQEHSQKPARVYQIIDQMYPGLPKIELFARKQYPGWDVWGNQATENMPCCDSVMTNRTRLTVVVR